MGKINQIRFVTLRITIITYLNQRFVIFFMVLLIQSANSLLAQFNPDNLFLTNIHLKQGLSQCVVTDLTIDKKGFVWAGTFDGLNRFDGSSFKIFRNNTEDPQSLISSRINRIYSDQNNHLYLITNLGFSIFDTRIGKTIQQNFVKAQNPVWICNADEFHVWMGTKNNNLLYVDTRDFTIINKIKSKYSFKCPLQELINTNQYVYQISLCGEILVFNKSTQTFNVLESKLLSGNVRCANVDKYDNLLISCDESGLVELNTTTNTFSQPSFQSKNSKLIGITKIAYNKNSNTLLLSSYGQGLFIYDYSNGSLSQFKKNEAPLSLSANYPISMTTNTEGLIFLGYDGMGIDMIDPNIKKFISIIKDDGTEDQTLKFVRKIAEGDDDNLFFGTSGSGLIKYNTSSKSFSFLNIKNKFNQPENFVIELIRSGNQLWMGFNGGGVQVVDIKTLKPIHKFEIGSKPFEISNGVIWSFLEDSKNNIWIGTRENGLNKINKTDFSVKQFDTSQIPSFMYNGLRCLYESKDHQILIGTEKGLFTMNPKNEKIVKVFPKPNDTLNHSFESIKCIYIDNNNRIWAGTDGGGLIILNTNFEIIKKINTNNYLTSNVVYSVLPQNDSTFWISTNSGLSKLITNKESLNPKGYLSVANFDESNGLQSNEFNTGAYLKLKDGRLAFGGLNGVNIFKGEDIQSNQLFPKVYINEFKVFENEFIGAQDISYSKSINLKHFENSISVSFNTLAFTKPDKIKYQYRLKGYDDGWINSNNRNYISYTNLKSGDYEFQVKASNNDGTWGADYTSLNIHIETAFYKTWWFITLLILAIAQIAYLIYRSRMNQIKEKEKLRIQYNKELAEVEMKALRAQINPHFLFNSLNSINNYILKNDTKLASKYLVKFSQLVRSILNNSSNPYITLQEELQTIELYMLIEGMRFNNQFSYKIETSTDINPSNLMIPSLLLQPYVENAIWHGLLHKDGEKLIKIIISKYKENSLKITIEDNGVGRKKSEEIEQKPKHRESFGMKLGESRLRLMNQENEHHANVNVIDLYDDVEIGVGTRIVIHIPIKPQVKTNPNLN